MAQQETVWVTLSAAGGAGLIGALLVDGLQHLLWVVASLGQLDEHRAHLQPEGGEGGVMTSHVRRFALLIHALSCQDGQRPRGSLG